MNSSITVAIIDDNDLCTSNLYCALTGYPSLQILGTAQNATAGKLVVLRHKPDLLFLDIELPDMSGLDLLRELQDQIAWPMQVVFYTAYDKYLLDALRQSAFDFLLKPFEQAELDGVMARYMKFRAQEKRLLNFRQALEGLLPSANSLLVSTVNGFQILRPEQIGYFRYANQGKQWVMYTTMQQELTLRRGTRAQDILGHSGAFVQINRDVIININFLAAIRGRECILLPPFERAGGLTASSNFLREVQERFSMI
jgi:two-component system LytT family response regulator